MYTDPQFGPFKLLRPFTGFNTVYEGQSAARRIMFSEVVTGQNGEPLADGSGTVSPPATVYAANTVRGLKVPLGARLIIYFPLFTWEQTSSPLVNRPYIWCFTWRLRSLFDFNTLGHGLAAHLPISTIPAGANPPMPAAYQMITYTASEPTDATDPEDRDRVVGTVRAEDLRIGADQLLAPLMPDGSAGVIQQGVNGTNPTLEGYAAYEMQAKGDELLIGIRRETDVVTNWTFATTDAALVSALNHAQMGVRISYGSAP